MSIKVHVKSTLSLAVLIAALSGCEASSGPKGTESNGRAAISANDRVTAGACVRKTLKLVTEQPGRVAPFEETPVFSKIAGYVESVHCDIGDHVKTGDMLVKLSVPEYVNELEQKRGLLAQAEAEVKQSEAALLALEAAVNSAKALVAQAESSVGRTEADQVRWTSEQERMQRLVKSGSVTSQLAEEATSQFRSAEAAKQEAQANVQSAQARLAEAVANVARARADVVATAARVRVAEANVQQAETMLKYTELRAPFDGVVTSRTIDTGHYVHPANSSASKPLLVVASTHQVRVFVDIPESEAGFVNAGYGDSQAGDSAVIRAQASNNLTLTGHITRSSWSLSDQNRSLTAEIDLPNENNSLLPGAYVTVSILLEQRNDVLTLPITAIVRDGESTRCCLVVGGKIVFRPIELGLRVKDEVEVTSGLDGTETVVLARAGSLVEGQSVDVIEKSAEKK